MLKLVKGPLDEISCTLLPGKYPLSGPVPPLYNDVYSYWRTTWQKFFEDAGSGPNALNIENFMRHTFIITLHTREKIVGTLCSSTFNLSAETTYDHSCVKPFPPEVLERMRNIKGGSCLTGEYLSVNREFKKDVTGLSMAEVMIGVLMKIFVNMNFDLALAATVRSAKVDEICKDYGYKEVGSYLKIGVDCIMLYNTHATLLTHPNPAVVKMVERCWHERADETGLTLPNGRALRKAA